MVNFDRVVGLETIKSDGLRILAGVEDETASGNVNVSLYHGKCNSVRAQPINIFKFHNKGVGLNFSLVEA